ncbi:MAG: SDR family oxidoreductase [Bacteroidetes bacterium]|nr:SDR family oxidoreductase [Bacteroidota bacterium]
MQKTIFITGASSGLGKATAILFQSKGWHVIATMRYPEKEMELKKLDNITLHELDVTNPKNIKDVVNKTISEHSVDVVLNNAGYGLIGPLEAFTDEQIARQIETNLMGPIRVTKSFIPYFREKKTGIFINITSMFGMIGYPTCSMYAASKFALDGFSESLAYDLSHFGVKVKIIAPGGIQTDFSGRSMDIATHDAYQGLIDKVSEGYNEESIKRYSTPEMVANAIFKAATDNNNQLRYIVGSDAEALYNERLNISPEGQYKKLREIFSF